MNEAVLTVQPRTIFGKRLKSLREQGLIPAVLYGPGIKEKPLVVKEKDFLELLKSMHENDLITLELSDGVKKERHRVLVQAIERHFLTQKVFHIDFYKFSAKKKVRVYLPIELVGKSPAEEQGGVVIQIMEKLEVECLPDAIPEKLEVDITKLRSLSDTLYVKDLVIPIGVEPQVDLETPVVSVVPVQQEEPEQREEEKISIPEAGSDAL